MEQSQRILLGVVLVVVGATIGAGVTAVTSTDTTASDGNETTIFYPNTDSPGVDQFESPQAFRSYVQRGRRLAQQETGFIGGANIIRRGSLDVGQPAVVYQQLDDSEQVSQSAEASGGRSDSPTQPNRVSETNVQGTKRAIRQRSSIRRHHTG